MIRRSHLSNPAIVGLLIVVLLAARWIWVAGLGDYGWTYEVAARILKGEVYYKEFPLLYGPLSHYTLAAFMLLLGHHLFVFHLHLWVSYVLSLAAGLLLVRELGASRSTQAMGISAAAVMACPVFSWSHAFNYQAPFLAGAGLLCILYARRGRPHVWAAGAGAFAALCIYDKQNVGLAIAALLPIFLPAGTAVYLSSFSATFLLIFAYFAQHAGAAEVWRQLLIDPSSVKGGLLILAGRAVPRLIFAPHFPFRRWAELAATGAVYAALLPVAIRMSRQCPAGIMKKNSSSAMGAACLIGTGAGVAISLAHIDTATAGKWHLYPWTFLLQLTYIFFSLLCAAYLVRGLEAVWAAAVWLILAVTAVQEASNPNFEYSAVLAMPLLCALLFRGKVTLKARTAGIILAVVYLVGTTTVGPVSYYGLCAYLPTYSLPQQSPFAHLRAPAPYVETVNEFWNEVRPLIKNRTTLWLVGGGGAYLAYGGLPVYNAPCYMPDTFPARWDQRFIQSWQKDPPEFVILRDDFQASPKSSLLTAEYMKRNLLSEYTQAWRSRTQPQIALWRRSGRPKTGP